MTEAELTTTAVTVEPIAGSNGDVDWALVGIIAAVVVVVLAMIWLVVAAGRSHTGNERAQSRHIRAIVGRAELIHGDVSLEVMAATAAPDRLRVIWADAHRCIDDLATEVASLARDTETRRAGDLRRLSHALGRLAGALDTHVRLQLQDTTEPSTQTALAASADTVAQRRNELLTALSPFRVRM